MHDLTAIPQRGTVEFEAARCAAAFGVGEWRLGFKAARDNFSVWQLLEPTVILHCQWDGDFWLSIRVGTYAGNGRDLVREGCCTWKDYDFNSLQLGSPKYNEIVARAFFCLGFEDESVLSQLPALSMHEQIELRHSMPREFWPQKWLDEMSAVLSKD